MDIKYDYHNNDLIADLSELWNNPECSSLTDWEMLCAVAKIVDKRRPPSSDMTDASTGLLYNDRDWINAIYERATNKAQRNAGQ